MSGDVAVQDIVANWPPYKARKPNELASNTKASEVSPDTDIAETAKVADEGR